MTISKLNIESDKIAFVVLAAGKGTRMKSNLAKVLHKVGEKKLIERVLSLTEEFGSKNTLSVISPDSNDVEEFISKNYNTKIIYQHEQLGTGDAVKACLENLEKFDGVVIILYGDTPFISKETVTNLYNSVLDKGTTVSVLGFKTNKENEYGRLILDRDGHLKEIVEFKEANKEQKKVTLCNSGVMAFDSKYIKEVINKIDNNNFKKEYYLTDAVKIANNMGLLSKAIITDENEVIGINSQQERAEAEKILQNNFREKHLNNGVIITAPETVFFSEETEIESGVEIEPYVVFKGKNKILSGSQIKSFSHIEDGIIGNNVNIGPYTRIRPGTELKTNSKVGNFVEVKNSKVGEGSKINHLSYIGDSEIGNNVNIGAGAITCNYDGENKHITKIGNNSFIGSNTEIIAPVTIGENSIIGAGTTVTKSVGDNKVLINEKAQIIKNKI